MPDGITHSVATISLAIVLGTISHYYGETIPIATIPLVSGTLAGLVLTPDLDVSTGSISGSIVKRAGGCLVGAAWRLFWMPYSKIIPHRSWVSHMPIISTVIRLIYLFSPLMVFYWLSGRNINIPIPWPWVSWSIVGLTMADTLHWMMDHVIKKC